MKKSTLTFYQTVNIMMLSIGLMNHVIVIPILLDAAKRDSWISVLFAGVLFLFWTCLLYTAVAKTRHQNVFVWLNNRVHPLLTTTLKIFSCLFLFAMSTITMRDTVTWIHVSFAPKTPILFLSLVLSLLCLFNAYMGIRSIANTAGIFLPFVVILGFFVMSSNFTHKNYVLLKPLLEYGMVPVWKGMLYLGAGFVELTLLLFMQQYIRTKYSLISLLILALILIGLTFGPVTGAIAEFGTGEAEKLRYPAYEEWRLINIGRYIEHMDFLSIYQWFTGAFIRISLAMFLIVDILALKSKVRKMITLVLLFSLTVIISIIPYSDDRFLDILTSYVIPAMFWLMLAISLIMIGLVNWAHKRKGANP